MGVGRDQRPPRGWEKRAQSLSPSSLQVPVSMCSKSCQPGQMKKPVGLHPCCFECLDCPPGTYLNRSAGVAPTPHPCCATLHEQTSGPLFTAQCPHPVLEFSGVSSLCQGLWGLPKGCKYPKARETRPGASRGFP